MNSQDKMSASSPHFAHKLPGLLPDFMIRDMAMSERMIAPFAEGIKRPGVISFGLTSTGYDVRLGYKFKMLSAQRCARLDPKNIDSNAFDEITVDSNNNQVWIPANGYILGESIEMFKIPRDITCLCLGKSTYARCGITINVTPGEPEWEGFWTIEIENASPTPTCVYAGEGIMQVLFFRSVLPCEKSYKDKAGKYQNATGLDHSRVDK